MDDFLKWANTKTLPTPTIRGCASSIASTIPPVYYDISPEYDYSKFVTNNPNYLDAWTNRYYDEERRLFNMYYNTKYVTRNYKTCTDELPVIKNVIFNDPATIVFWDDGTKTVVKCMEGKEFNTWDGLAMAICKKLFGKKFKKTFRTWCGK